MKSKTMRILCGIGAVLIGVFTILLRVFENLLTTLTDTFLRFVYLLIGNPIPEKIEWYGFASFFILLVLYAFCSGLIYLTFSKRKNALIAVSVTIALLLLTFLFIPPPDNVNHLRYFLPIPLGSFGCIGCILLYGWLQKKLPAVFNRETVSYIVFGVLTTVVSFVSQMLFSAAGFPVIVNTIGSWVCAVLFAYIVNKLFVFESKTATMKAFWRELGLFIGARVASLGMELVFMFVTVELLHFSEAVCKLIAQIFILIANYVLSKLIIFKKN